MTLTADEKANLQQADEMDRERVRIYGTWLNCVGAVDMYQEAKRLRAGVRAAVYHRGGQSTGLPRYKEAYICAAFRAVREAGLD